MADEVAVPETVTFHAWLTAIRAATDLPDKTFRVALLVASFASRKTGTGAHPGRKQLADLAGLSERRVSDHLKALRDLGWIVRTRKGSTSERRKFADEYRLAVPEVEDHRTPERPLVDEQPPDVETPTTGRSEPTTGRSGVPPSSPEHRSDSDESASGRPASDSEPPPEGFEPPPEPDTLPPDDMDQAAPKWILEFREECDEFDSSMQRIDASVTFRTNAEAQAATEMLMRDFHPKAVANTIRRQRKVS